MPSHAIASKIPCTHSGRLRAASVSSIRSTIVPPDCRPNTQLNSTERALPTWNIPVGEGAKRTRMAELTMALPYRAAGPTQPHAARDDHQIGGRVDAVPAVH